MPCRNLNYTSDANRIMSIFTCIHHKLSLCRFYNHSIIAVFNCSNVSRFHYFSSVSSNTKRSGSCGVCRLESRNWITTFRCKLQLVGSWGFLALSSSLSWASVWAARDACSGFLPSTWAIVFLRRPYMKPSCVFQGVFQLWLHRYRKLFLNEFLAKFYTIWNSSFFSS